MEPSPRSGCAINAAVEVLGDPWAILVLRDIMFGNLRHFRELVAASEEGIATNILASRLKQLVAAGVLSRDAARRGQRATYSLTEAGIQVLPIMVALGNWGLAHRAGERRLRVRAELLRDGGPEVVAAMMDELRELHLGVPHPDPDTPRPSELLREVYEAAIRGDAGDVLEATVRDTVSAPESEHTGLSPDDASRTTARSPHRRAPDRTALAACIMLAGVLAGCTARDQREEHPPMQGSVQHLNPDGLHKNPAYSQAVVVTGNVKTVYVGGQNAVDDSGTIVGEGDIKAQTEQVLRNVETALAAAGAGLEHVVKWNVLIVEGQPLLPGFEAFQSAWGDRPNPPIVTAMFVAGLAVPDFLVEIDAIAVVPQE